MVLTWRSSGLALSLALIFATRALYVHLFRKAEAGTVSTTSSQLVFPSPGPDVGPQLYGVSLAALCQTPGTAQGETDAADSLASTFVPSSRDADTDAFLATAASNGRNISLLAAAAAQQRKFADAQRTLGLSRTDASAMYLKRPMLVATTAQFRNMLSHSPAGSAQAPPSLLDVGAGIGEVTSALAAALDVQPSEVTAMEASAPLRSQLSAKGYRVALSFDELESGSFGAVSLLNVLDRCDAPYDVLKSALRVLHPAGTLLVATVIPFCAKVHYGARGRINAARPPTAPITLPPGAGCEFDRRFEPLAKAFASAVFGELPLRVGAWTRVPYLSLGGTSKTYHYLDNAIFALRRADIGGTATTGQNSSDGGRVCDAVVAAAANAGGAVAFTAPEACNGQNIRASFRWFGEWLSNRQPGGWGDVLDSGVGRTSLCWLLAQRFRTITGITALGSGAAYGFGPLQDVAHSAGERVRLLHGNWRDEDLLTSKEGHAQQSFDVVLLDYLLAAVPMHWPYSEEEVLWRVLRTVRRQGGLALVTGIEPYDLTLDGRARPAEKVVLDVEALGDAAALLGQRRTYRELPMEWVVKQVERVGGFRVVARKTFPMTLSRESLRSQLAFARAEAEHVTDAELRSALLAAARRLYDRTSTFGRTSNMGYNYAVVLERL